MVSVRDFQFFDPDGEVTVTSGDLPHWQQRGATYFITYRTIDSIPAEAMERIIAERDHWLKLNGIDAKSKGWPERLRRLPLRQQQSFHRHFAIQFEKELDGLAGECLLQRPQLMKIVADSLRHFDGQRYLLGGYVVMPNHVHVLARVFLDYDMLDVCFSWKHFQAYRVHQHLGRTGHFFQPESFDHLVRDADQFFKYRRYISDNPVKANLRDNQATVYLPKM